MDYDDERLQGIVDAYMDLKRQLDTVNREKERAEQNRRLQETFPWAQVAPFAPQPVLQPAPRAHHQMAQPFMAQMAPGAHFGAPGVHFTPVRRELPNRLTAHPSWFEPLGAPAPRALELPPRAHHDQHPVHPGVFPRAVVEQRAPRARAPRAPRAPPAPRALQLHQIAFEPEQNGAQKRQNSDLPRGAPAKKSKAVETPAVTPASSPAEQEPLVWTFWSVTTLPTASAPAGAPADLATPAATPPVKDAEETRLEDSGFEEGSSEFEHVDNLGDSEDVAVNDSGAQNSSEDVEVILEASGAVEEASGDSEGVEEDSEVNNEVEVILESPAPSEDVAVNVSGAQNSSEDVEIILETPAPSEDVEVIFETSGPSEDVDDDDLQIVYDGPSTRTVEVDPVQLAESLFEKAGVPAGVAVLPAGVSAGVDEEKPAEAADEEAEVTGVPAGSPAEPAKKPAEVVVLPADSPVPAADPIPPKPAVNTQFYVNTDNYDELWLKSFHRRPF